VKWRLRRLWCEKLLEKLLEKAETVDEVMIFEVIEEKKRRLNGGNFCDG